MERIPNDYPVGWIQMVADVAKATEGIAYIRSTVDDLKKDINKMEATQIPVSEHVQLLNDVRSIRDSYLITKWVGRVTTGIAIILGAQEVWKIAHG